MQGLKNTEYINQKNIEENNLSCFYTMCMFY